MKNGHKLEQILKSLLDHKDITKARWAIEELVQENKRYNGWVNYETWAINLWLTNEQPLYAMMLESEDREQLKELVENLCDSNDEQGMRRLDIISDLVNASLSEVDYRELWRHVEETKKEIEEYEEKET